MTRHHTLHSRLSTLALPLAATPTHDLSPCSEVTIFLRSRAREVRDKRIRNALRSFFRNAGRAICAATALSTALVFTVNTPITRIVLCAPFEFKVSDIHQMAGCFEEFRSILAERAHVRVVLKEPHEPSLPQHGERFLDEVNAIQSAVPLLTRGEYYCPGKVSSSSSY